MFVEFQGWFLLPTKCRKLCVCVFLRGYPFGAYKSTRSQSPQHALRSCNSNRGGFQESPLSSGPGSLARGKEINEDLAALWSHFRKFCGCTFLGAWAQRRCVFVGLGSDWPMSRPSGGNLCGAGFWVGNLCGLSSNCLGSCDLKANWVPEEGTHCCLSNTTFSAPAKQSLFARC